MNTNLIPLSRRTDFPHTYVLTSDKQKYQNEDVSIPSPRSLTRLQRARLAAQEVTFPYFKGDKILFGQTVSSLEKGDAKAWNEIVDAKLIFASKKSIQIALKKFLRDKEWERLNEYLQECRKKLKENFRQLYLKTLEKKENLKQLQVKDHITNKGSF